MSAGTVPNGSKQFPTGRPAKVSDEELQACVSQLANENGKMPTLNQIIEASGGCQRARAVKARHAAVEHAMQQQIYEQLQLPGDLETRHRQLLSQWLNIARSHVEPSMKALVADAEQRADQAELSAQDARDKHDAITQELQKLQRSVNDLSDQLTLQTDKIAALSSSEAKWKALANERKAMLMNLNHLKSDK
ncbi:MAG: hypothetical protein ACSHXK_15150 [Oceanococcus sp.]